MTIHSSRRQTGQALAAALLGRQRAVQDVRILTSAYSGSVLGARHLVAVGDQYYSVRDLTLQQLRLGVTPAELDLDPVNPDEEAE